MADKTIANGSMNIVALQAEHDVLKRLIEAAGSWGAGVSVMQERIDGIDRILAGGA